MADQVIQFGDLAIPCSVWRGLIIGDAPMDKRLFHPPGTHGTIVRMLGLLPRPIIVPVCIHSISFQSVDHVMQMLDRIKAAKAKGNERSLKIPVDDTVLSFSKCFLESWQPSPRGFQKDVVNGLGRSNRWYIEGVLTFFDVLPVKAGEGGSSGGSGDIDNA